MIGDWKMDWGSEIEDWNLDLEWALRIVIRNYGLCMGLGFRFEIENWNWDLK